MIIIIIIIIIIMIGELQMQVYDCCFVLYACSWSYTTRTEFLKFCIRAKCI